MKRFMHGRMSIVVGAVALSVVLGAAVTVPASIQSGLDSFSTSDASERFDPPASSPTRSTRSPQTSSRRPSRQVISTNGVDSPGAGRS